MLAPCGWEGPMARLDGRVKRGGASAHFLYTQYPERRREPPPIKVLDIASVGGDLLDPRDQ